MRLFLSPKADKALIKLDAVVKEEITKRIKQLKEDPQKGKPLKYSKFWRLRVGDYRAIYEIKKDKIVVLFIEHRKNVYHDFSKLL